MRYLQELAEAEKKGETPPEIPEVQRPPPAVASATGFGSQAREEAFNNMKDRAEKDRIQIRNIEVTTTMRVKVSVRDRFRLHSDPKHRGTPSTSTCRGEPLHPELCGAQQLIPPTSN